MGREDVFVSFLMSSESEGQRAVTYIASRSHLRIVSRELVYFKMTATASHHTGFHDFINWAKPLDTRGGKVRTALASVYLEGGLYGFLFLVYFPIMDRDWNDPGSPTTCV